MTNTQVQLDSVLTIAIGRNGQDGEPMSDSDWTQFQLQVAAAVRAHGGTIVGSAAGHGLGSDGLNDGQVEETAIFVILIDVDRLNGLRLRLASVLRTFDQQSAAFAFDLGHEPVFSTHNGWRPEVLEDWTADGHSRRTMPQ